jgi:oligopeptidase A
MSLPHPFLDPSFHIRWSLLSADRVGPDVSRGIEEARERLDALKALREEDLTFDRVLLGFESATRDLDLAWGKVTHLDAVCNAPELREAHNAMLPKVTSFYSGIALDENLWKVIKAYGETAEARTLSGVRRRFLAEVMKDFRESGADLEPARKTRLEAVKAELARLTQKFSENVLDATNAWERIVCDERLLAGLPEQARSLAREAARAKGLGSDEAPAWRFTLHQPSLVPVLQFADSDELRRACWTASVSVGRTPPHENADLIWRILELRDEMAKLLGFPHFSDFATHRRMARSGACAWRFTGDLHDRASPFFAREVASLEAFKAAQTGGAPSRLAPWELAYWAEKQRRALYDFDKEALRPYLPMAGVIAGLFALSGRLFGIEIRERPTLFAEPGRDRPSVRAPAGAAGAPVEVWHPEVAFYEVFDAGRHLGSFYCDWYPRASKRGGAWMNFFHTGGPRPGGAFAPHLGLMVGNMTPALPGRPALLSHDDVTTVFHEFGHLLHHLLSDVEIESLSGTRVPSDFVELPSQIMENWCWKKESLDLFARHHESGEALPRELLEKLIRSSNYRAASAMMGQLAYGRLDLDLHIHLDEVRGMELDEHWRTRLDGYLTPTSVPAPSMAHRFTHLFGHTIGYASAYYAYKWAEVLEADAFTRFEREGILNPATGRALREHILSRGNSAPPEELFRAFMGRDPDPNALFVREGLVDSAL